MEEVFVNSIDLDFYNMEDIDNRKENGKIMGKLIIDGNKVYTVDEACMKKKNLTLAQICKKEPVQTQRQQHGRRKGRN